jgi:ABC-2 type transport system ATP-binding protein
MPSPDQQPPPGQKPPSQTIEIRSLGKSYASVMAVAGLDLDVAAGEIVALLGPNGAGKTTTIRMLMGQLRPSSGSARIAGLDCFAERPAVMRQVGYLPDEPVFHDYLTGRELVRFVGALHQLDAITLAQRGAHWIDRLGLGEAIDDYAVNYSKGMRKKLALTLALLSEPRVLILDEPANGLDPYATRELLAIVRERAEAGTTVLFSTHLIDQAERLCQRAAIMARGRLVAAGTIADLRRDAAGGGSLEAAFFAVTAPEGGAPATAP